MNYLALRNRFFEFGCFNTHQVLAWYPAFQHNNFTRWLKQGLLIRLRRGYYSFPEYLHENGFERFVSNYMYKPSYLSTHGALAFYGMIPEAVPVCTAVSTLKTASFSNSFGTFSYQQIKRGLFFGYERKSAGTHSILMATPEKAILDLLYLYPFYDTEEALINLRLDADFMHSGIDETRLREYTARFGNEKLATRVELLREVYD
jgi:predicted transcriptional regulator of viral defense system